jgi:hypothetical protein
MLGDDIYPAWETFTINELENHHVVAGKIHYFDWAMFNSYVKLPEGIYT